MNTEPCSVRAFSTESYIYIYIERERGREREREREREIYIYIYMQTIYVNCNFYENLMTDFHVSYQTDYKLAVQFSPLTGWVFWGNMRDDSAKILFQSFM